MLKKLLLVLALALSSSGVFAQGAAKDGQLALLYDVDSTSLTYCTIQGQNGGPFADPIPVGPAIKTTGSSTTVVEATASTNPFTGIVVGDVLVIKTPSATNASAMTVVAVTAKASNASITVDTAINITGNFFGYYHHLCGTTDADGWFSPGSASARVGLLVQYDQGDLGSLVVRWEKRAAGAGSAPTILYPGGASDCGALGFALSTDRCEATTAGILARLEVLDDAPTGTQYRVGVAYVTSDASDATTNREKVTIKVSVR
jgi:hypothetical protein